MTLQIEAPRQRTQEEIDAWHLENAAKSFACGAEWQEFLVRRFGTSQWVVAPRLTERLRLKGYKFAISPKDFSRLEIGFGMPRLRKALFAYAA